MRSSFEESCDTRIRSPSLFSLALWCFVFQHFAFCSLKMRFSIELFCGGFIRGRLFLGKKALSFCYVDLLAFSIEVYRPLKIYTMILGAFWVLWCFVFQHLGKHGPFHSGFLLRNGVPFVWCCSGALCAERGRFSFFGLLVAFAVALGCLWARRVWSGRLGPGIILVVFLGRPFGARNGHMDSA